jgi:hypothetical protein
MISSWSGAKKAARQWVSCPCDKHAKLALEEAKKKETKAEAADDASTERGDWWSYEAVREVYVLCEAIALHSGLPEPDPDDPFGVDPSDAVLWVCSYFAGFPSNVERSLERAKAVVENR